MDRRAFISGATLGFLAAPLAVEAQPAGKVYRIGFLSGSSAVASKSRLEQFRQGLREFGYVEGQNIIIEFRWAEAQLDRLPQLAIDLVRIAPDLIVAVASQSAVAAHNATTSIPIVMVNVGDPVYLGLATSLGRPGKNLTGLTSFGPELAGKQLGLLKEVVPEGDSLAEGNGSCGSDGRPPASASEHYRTRRRRDGVPRCDEGPRRSDPRRHRPSGELAVRPDQRARSEQPAAGDVRE
jgi:putative ABC transport system substrate-binding protein